MSHRSDAEATLLATRELLASVQGQNTPTDVSIAVSARAQAIATAAVAQAVLALADTITTSGYRPAHTQEPQR